MESRLIEELRAVLDRYSVERLKFETGKWYIDKDVSSKKMWCIEEIHGDCQYSFGFGYNGDWVESQRRNSTPSEYRLATDGEVLSAFTNYFRGNGFKEGSRFKNTWNGIVCEYVEPLSFFEGGVVSKACGQLFNPDNLTLATLIEEEKIMIGGSEVEFEKGVNGNFTGNTLVNTRWIHKLDYEALLPANPELFQKILDKLRSK